jgi:hypothetical protein
LPTSGDHAGQDPIAFRKLLAVFNRELKKAGLTTVDRAQIPKIPNLKPKKNSKAENFKHTGSDATCLNQDMKFFWARMQFVRFRPLHAAVAFFTGAAGKNDRQTPGQQAVRPGARSMSLPGADE